ATGKFDRLGRLGALGVSAAGFGVAALLVAFGPYPMSMIGMPGAPVSNMDPPSACLLPVAVGQLGLLLAARPVLLRLAGRGRVGAVLRWVAPRSTAIYLWHMSALVV